MNKEWSDLHKIIQNKIKKESTFNEGIETLLELRQQLTNTLLSLKTELTREEFNAIPFINANGYHNKTIIYSLWHIFRIEDIVVHTLIKGDEQIFFSENYQERISLPIITTGNELKKQQIVDFSKQLNLEEMYNYINAVINSTNGILKKLSYLDSKQKITNQAKKVLNTQKVVSTDKEAYWLIDYWCSKDVKGLMQMPFSRHWIMHIQACLRIKNKIHPL